MSRHRIIIWFLLSGAVLGLTSCSERKLHDAQAVVAAADSLRAEGQTYTDSLNLAEAYRTLGNRSRFYPDDYAHACYHYGRLLREKDNPVEAMQVFINATHSRSRDYHILGRIYSNMGSLCHLAGEYDLSYDMYEHSANMFLSSGDTLSYYYALNDMAVELAEQGKKENTLDLISIIQQQCTDAGVMLRVDETAAELYRVLEESDSALYWIDHAQQYGDISHYGTIIKAQAFDNLGMKDSAIYYAELILSDTFAIYHAKFNALYIITHNDSTLNKDSALAIASQREDIRHYEYEPKKEQFIKTVQLLEQNLQRRPNLSWLYAVFATLGLIGCGVCIYVYRKKKQHKLLSQQVNELEDIHLAEKQQHERMVREHTEYEKSLVSQIEQTCAVFYKSEHLVEEICWSNYNQMCAIVDQQLYFITQKLQTTYALNEREVRLCVLVLIGISNSKQLANMLYYGESGIRNLKNRTAKKLSTNSVELRKKLLKIAAGAYSSTNT